MKRNPRRTKWTRIYRRLNRKGTQEEIAKRRSRRTKKFQRGVVGASLEMIRATRNQAPEVRAAQRESAIRVAKEKNKAKQDAKKKDKEKEKVKTQAPRQNQPKGNKAQNLGGKKKPTATSR